MSQFVCPRGSSTLRGLISFVKEKIKTVEKLFPMLFTIKTVHRHRFRSPNHSNNCYKRIRFKKFEKYFQHLNETEGHVDCPIFTGWANDVDACEGSNTPWANELATCLLAFIVKSAENIFFHISYFISFITKI